MTPSAAPLLSRLRAGDEDALRELCRSLAPQAHALAQRIAGAHAAEAVVEEVLLLIWREPQRWGAETLQLEALRCVRDVSLAVRQRGISAASALAQWQRPPVAPHADALSVDRESAERVRAALFTLSDAQRDLLEAAWFEGVEPGSAALTAALTEALDALAEAIGAQP